MIASFPGRRGVYNTARTHAHKHTRTDTHTRTHAHTHTLQGSQFVDSQVSDRLREGDGDDSDEEVHFTAVQ